MRARGVDEDGDVHLPSKDVFEEVDWLKENDKVTINRLSLTGNDITLIVKSYHPIILIFKLVFHVLSIIFTGVLLHSCYVHIF